MSERENTMEFHGNSVEEAVESGLKAMGLARSEADIEVLEEGSKGLFGLGSKEALVRITRKSPEAAGTQAPAEDATEFSEDPFDDDDEFDDDDDDDDDEDDYDDDDDEEDDYDDDDDEDDDEEDDDEFDDDDEFSEEQEIVAVTRETVIELLSKMHVSADVDVKLTPKDPHSRRASVSVDITGDDLSILIGRKAETLDALQYITRLIVGKELSSSVIINIDVQGYKKRREQRLRRIAQSVARQAIETGRRQYLEPMSAADRRIIHMTLRDNPNVYTESVGEGYRRKVTINPK